MAHSDKLANNRFRFEVIDFNTIDLPLQTVPTDKNRTISISTNIEHLRLLGKRQSDGFRQLELTKSWYKFHTHNLSTPSLLLLSFFVTNQVLDNEQHLSLRLLLNPV